MQSPISEAQRICQALGTTFERELALYLEYGHVISAPDRLMLLRPCAKERPDLWLTDNSKANAWNVYLAVGKVGVRWFFDNQPWPLPYVLWARGLRGSLRPHIYESAKFTKHI